MPEIRPQRIAVIGAGPVGLEAALYAALAGCDVQVFERGRIAGNVLDWGHVRLFTPFGLNASEWGRRTLSAAGGELPAEDAILTGTEFARRYLIPLSRTPSLRERIHEGASVRGVGRAHTWKGDLIGRPERQWDPFRLLLSDDRREWHATADIVLDCSGTYPNAGRVGPGGIPAVGEAEHLRSADYRLPDILGSQRDAFAGRTALVIGGGFSGAAAVVQIAELADAVPGTRAIWLTRTPRRPPLVRIAGDALPERDRLAERANALALAAGGPIDWRPARVVQRIDRDQATSGYRIHVESMAEQGGAEQGGAGQAEVLTADRIIANVGYRPDVELFRELQVHQCYASEAPMKLAAALAGETSSDCLAQTGHGPDALRTTELGFFILGAKSYGRDSRFLLRIGHQQIRDVFRLITDGHG